MNTLSGTSHGNRNVIVEKHLARTKINRMFLSNDFQAYYTCEYETLPDSRDFCGTYHDPRWKALSSQVMSSAHHPLESQMGQATGMIGALVDDCLGIKCVKPVETLKISLHRILQIYYA